MSDKPASPARGRKKTAPPAQQPPQEGVVVRLPLTDLHPFPDHPFQVRDDEEMRETIQSVKEYGVIIPAIVRPREEGGYLDALELSGHTEERPYFYKGQVEKIKAIQALLTQDLTKNYTLEELSARFDIALTPMKNCFKSVYGSPIFTYMRNYRMNYAASLLKSDRSLKVAEIAGLVGYDSPSKFASAFHQTMGKTPLEYRKSII